MQCLLLVLLATIVLLPPLSYEYYYTVLPVPVPFLQFNLVQLSCLLVHVRMYLLRRAVPILSCALFTFFLVMLAWRATPRTPGPPKPWPHPQMDPRKFERPSLFLVILWPQAAGNYVDLIILIGKLVCQQECYIYRQY